MVMCYGIILLCWALVGGVFVRAGLAESTETSAPMTLKKALEIAFQHHPRMVEAQKNVVWAQGSVSSACALPPLDVRWEVGENNNVVEVEQAFEPLGFRMLQRDIAKDSVAKESLLVKRTWIEVRSDVIEFYYDMALDTKQYDLVQEKLNIMRQCVGWVQQKYMAGQVLKNDYQRAKIALLQVEQEYLAVDQERTMAKARLNVALGRAMEADVVLDDVWQEHVLYAAMQKLKGGVVDKQPSLQVAQIEHEISKKKVCKERLQSLPAYSVGMRRSYEDNEEDHAVLLGISLPLWERNKGALVKAKAEESIKNTHVQAVYAQTELDLYGSYVELDLAYQQFLLCKKMLNESNELLRLADLHYREGKVNFLNYLDQITTVSDVKKNYYQSLFHWSQSISACMAMEE